MKMTNIHNYGRKIFLFLRNDDGSLEIKEDNSFFPYYYESCEEGNALGYDGQPLKRLFVGNPSDVAQRRTDTSYEADILFTKRYLIDKVNELHEAKLRYYLFDMEVLVPKGADMPQPLIQKKAPYPISCITLYDSLTQQYHTWYLGDYKNESDLWFDFMNFLKKNPPDILVAHNMYGFDYPYLHYRIPEFAKRISPIGQNRYGQADIAYPAGIGIVDYLEWFKKFTLNKEPAYGLEDLMVKYLGYDKGQYKNIDFSQLGEHVKGRCEGDVEGMVKIEEKMGLIPHFDMLRRISFVDWEDMMWNCLDEKSEILTKSGWKNYQTIADNDLVLSYNLFTKEYEYVPIIESFNDDYEGTMIQYEAPRVNFNVTPNHKFPMIMRRNDGRYDLYEDIVFERASHIPSQRRKFILGCSGYTGGTYRTLTDDEVKLCAWIITEGYFDKKRTRDFGGAIYIYQTMKNISKRAEIMSTLIGCGIDYIERKDGFVIPSAFATKYRVLLQERKQIPEVFFELPNSQMRLFIDVCIKGDGHRQTGASNGYICTADETLAEQYQRLATLAGYNCYVTTRTKDSALGRKLKSPKLTYYCNILFENLDVEYKKHRKTEVAYQGKIWCVQTQNENFVMRRENRVCVSGNSRIIDMFLLREAKKSNVALPMKPRGEDVQDDDFEGAFRDAFETGAFYDIGKYDLSGAYCYAIIDLCLDSVNILDMQTPETITVDVKDRRTQEVMESYFVRQNKDALLPKVVEKLVNEKNKLKKLMNDTNPEDPAYTDIEKRYSAFKTVVLSAWGVIGNKYFRRYDKRVASMTTGVVRDLLHYVFDELEKLGHKVIYIDTDSCFIQDNGKNLEPLLNDLVNQWAMDRFGKKVSIQFDYEGHFVDILILAKCRYIGYLKNKRGEIKPEVKGVEAKRKDSTEYMKEFQRTLIDKILKIRHNEETKQSIYGWLMAQFDEIKKQPLQNISFPCKVSKKPEQYKNIPIFLRALMETPGFDKEIGERFWWSYVEPEYYTEEKEEVTYHRVVPGKREGTTKKERVKAKEINDLKEQADYNEARFQALLKEAEIIEEKRTRNVKKARDVMAFDEDKQDHLRPIDWDKMIQRNIQNKLETIFIAMKWTDDLDKFGVKYKPKTTDEVDNGEEEE